MQRSIPGYYYDEEKKKFFKITKDYLQSQKRKLSKNIAIKNVNSISRSKSDHFIKQIPILQELNKRSVLGPCACKVDRSFFRSQFRQLNNKEMFFDIPWVNEHNPDLVENAHFLKFNKDGRFLIIGRRKSLDIFSTHHQANEERNFKLNLLIRRYHQRQYSDNRRFSPKPEFQKFCFEWSPHTTNGALCIMNFQCFLRPGFIQTSAELHLFPKDIFNTEDNHVMRRLNDTFIHCCSMCRHENMYQNIVIGDDNKQIKSFRFLYDGHISVEQVFKLKSQPKAMHSFASKLPGTIAGLKSGNITIIDHRCHSDNQLNCPKLTMYCIDCIHLHQNEDYVTFSNWGGALQTIDLRMNKILSTYNGHVNNAYDLEFHLDRREEYLYAVGADSNLRIWDIKTSNLVISKQMPSRELGTHPPAISFTDQWSGDASLPGLLCLDGNQVQFVPGL